MEASGPTAASELFGRDGELGLIEVFIAGTATGGGALLLFGEPGVGKTVLLDAAATRAAAAGLRAVRAAGVEFEADLPFSGLHQLLLPLHEEFSKLNPAPQLGCELLPKLTAAGPGSPVGAGTGRHPAPTGLAHAS